MKALNLFGTICGLLGMAVGFLAWFGITPEVVGDAAYGVFHAVLPFWMIMCGFGIGFWACKIKDRSLIAEKNTEIAELEKCPTREQMDKVLSELETTKEHLAQIEALYTHLRGCDLKCQAYEELAVHMLEKMDAVDTTVCGERLDEIRLCKDPSKLKRMR